MGSHMGMRSAQGAPNAAMLIDFDNVTMGIRSDLGKELKTLMESDLIRGKVAVQRAYADWRRYPQYINPLSEASIDLIFAPAYGSSKKNATDLRMAIDGMELVFTRPEIGTYILLTGDSDFSSLVLKLKEYGKYVIGVGMRQSSSDILVQNCDEYYSYHSLSGLRRSAEDAGESHDPWKLVERALERMVSNRDVMRSDRLKQVMLQMDSGFDEKELGYKKFSRFVQEAAGKGLLKLRKLENGQHELLVDGAAPEQSDTKGPRNGRGRGRSRSGRGREEVSKQEPVPAPEPIPQPKSEPTPEEAPPSPMDSATAAELPGAFRLLQDALRAVGGIGSAWARDADVKRKMLDMVPEFDEGNLGFSKFSRFLQKAHDAEMVDLDRIKGGGYQVVVGASTAPAPSAKQQPVAKPEPEPKREVQPTREEVRKTERHDHSEAATPTRPTASPSGAEKAAVRASRRARGRGQAVGGAPPILPGQVVGATSTPPAPKTSSSPVSAPASLGELDLPSGAKAIQAYLANSYKGVGKKTAERLLEALGDELFTVMENDPDRVREAVGAKRAGAVLEQWVADRDRRREKAS